MWLFNAFQGTMRLMTWTRAPIFIFLRLCVMDVFIIVVVVTTSIVTGSSSVTRNFASVKEWIYSSWSKVGSVDQEEEELSETLGLRKP